MEIRTLSDGQTEFPTIVLTDLSSACNAECVMCPTQLSPLRKQMMRPALFESLVEQVAAFPVNRGFYIGVHGEPLLDKHLAKKVALCRSAHIDNVVITTNGSLLTPARAADLLAAGPQRIIISLESMSPEVFETIRVGLKHDVVVQNIKSTVKLRDEMRGRTEIVVRFIVQKRNAAEYVAYEDYWRDYLNPAYGDHVAGVQIHNWGHGDPTRYHGNTPCLGITTTTVLSDGSVVLCCIDHDGVHCLGNMTEQPLLDIYNNEKGRHLRMMHGRKLRHLLDLCKTCDLAEQWAGVQAYPLYNEFNAVDRVSETVPGVV